MTDPATFLVDDSDLPALRRAALHLSRIGYSENTIKKRLTVSDIKDIQWRAMPIYRKQHLSLRAPLDCAIDLFFLQGIISKDELNSLFESDEQDALTRAGLLSIDEQGSIRARASIFPVGDHLIFSDHAWPKLPHPGYIDVPSDLVMFIGSDSRWLERTTIRNPIESALDLCTGSGIHALLAASHAKRVLAVDISQRAARCTHFNAQVIGRSNVEVAVGNLFEPVQGERFDLITANPPFVPSPLNTLKYRDGGPSGEDIQRDIVAGLPQHLAQGGIAQIVTELGERENESLSTRLRSWLGGAPMDIIILRLSELTASSYAIGHAQGDYDYGEYLDSVQAWSDNLDTQGYSRIVAVLLAFQWSDPTIGSPWTRIEETRPPVGNASFELKAMFEAERLARNPNLLEMLEQSSVQRTGPIGFLEGRVLGSDMKPTTQAQLLGKALQASHFIEPIEREILVLMDKPLRVPELIRELKVGKETVLLALQSLLRWGFVMISMDD